MFLLLVEYKKNKHFVLRNVFAAFVTVELTVSVALLSHKKEIILIRHFNTYN